MTQKEMILAYLEKNGSITQKEAIDNFGCYRLPARIGELKERGIKFKTYMEEGINRFGTRERHARYTIQRANDGA
jgi:hypothetical protein